MFQVYTICSKDKEDVKGIFQEVLIHI